MRISHLYQLLTESLLLESYNQLKDIFDINTIHLPYRREFETLSTKNGFNNMTVPEVFEYLVKKEPHIFRGEGVSENEFRKLVNVQFWVSQFIKDPTRTQSFVLMINARLEARLERVTQKAQENDYEVLIKTNEYVLYKPNSEAASCKLGKGTKWCTAATQGTNHFNEYRDQGELYYIHTRLPHPFDKIAIFIYNHPDVYEIFNSQNKHMRKSEVVANLGFEHTVDIFFKIGLDVEDDSVTYTAYMTELVDREQFLDAVEEDADSTLESNNIFEYMNVFADIISNSLVLLTDVIDIVGHEMSGDNAYKQFFRDNDHYETSFITIERKIRTSGVTEVSPDEDILRALAHIRADVIGLFSERYITEVEAMFKLVERMKRSIEYRSYMSEIYDDAFAWGDHALRLIDSVGVGPATLKKSNVLSFIYNYDFQAKLDIENAYRELS